MNSLQSVNNSAYKVSQDVIQREILVTASRLILRLSLLEPLKPQGLSPPAGWEPMFQ